MERDIQQKHITGKTLKDIQPKRFNKSMKSPGKTTTSGTEDSNDKKENTKHPQTGKTTSQEGADLMVLRKEKILSLTACPNVSVIALYVLNAL